MAESQRFPKRREVALLGDSVELPPAQNTNYEAVQAVGAAKQDPISLHEAESWLPMLVFLMVTQKTNTTRSTIKAYSTSPWPSSSIISLFKSCILFSPPFLEPWGARRSHANRFTLAFVGYGNGDNGIWSVAVTELMLVARTVSRIPSPRYSCTCQCRCWCAWSPCKSTA